MPLRLCVPSNSLVAHVNADSPHDVCRLSTCLARETALLLLPALCSLLSAAYLPLILSHLNLVPARAPFILLSHAGRTGSIALWDNRCTQHLPLDDYAGRRREMIRVTIGAQVPA